MSKEAIKKFNYITGNYPVGIDGDKEAIWSQLELTSRLLLEEAQEMHTAALNRDILEYLDGNTDCWYVREYADDLLKALGVDVPGAKYEVCYNNDQKYTTSETLALDTWADYAKKGKAPEVCKVDYEGKTYYTVKIDGKVNKLLFHVRPNLSECVPDYVKEKLNG